jgi:hypothetical protein
LEIFRLAVSDAKTGDDLKREYRDEAMANLMSALLTLADHLDIIPDATAIFYKEAGFQIRNENGAKTSSANEELPAPQITKAISTGLKGELSLKIDMEDVTGFKQFALEFSEDNGQSWKTNDSFTARKTYTWRKLPSNAALVLRARATGSHDRVSTWSNIVMTPVI